MLFRSDDLIVQSQRDFAVFATDRIDGNGGCNGVDGEAEGVGAARVTGGIPLGCGDGLAAALADGAEIVAGEGIRPHTIGIGCCGAEGDSTELDADGGSSFCGTDDSLIIGIGADRGIDTTDGCNGDGWGEGVNRKDERTGRTNVSDSIGLACGYRFVTTLSNQGQISARQRVAPLPTSVGKGLAK